MNPTLRYPTDLKTDQWFEELIMGIKSDYLQISTGLASKEKTQLYNTLMKNDVFELASMSREQSARILISNIISEYLNEINSFEKKPQKLALKLSVSEILVWAEIQDDDEDTEDSLLITEAKINSKFYELGFHLNTTVIEHSDKLNIPSHYQPVIN